ncbi:EamA family transporter [Acetobacterium paludosum]|uniref:EamA family transporter n=1 Tax=Acetobacterium paludosum TaxID=52693 RepID=A0A923KTV1_9FIRM|nr:DMT family transporter [Acetobacterium paludosum]MBC3889822.1 EamA family transporter [Acetobacterium paludosum]
MDKTSKYPLYADLGLIAVSFVWGSGFVASKNALNSMTPMMLMALRFSIAALLSGIIFRKNLRNLSKETIKAGCIIGFFLFSAFAAQMIGLQYMLAGKQAFLTGTNVIMVPFIYWAVKKNKPDKYNFMAAFIMITGLALLTIDFSVGFSFNIGDALTLLCAFLYACHIVVVGMFSKQHDPIALTVIQLAFAAIISLIYVFWSGEFTIVIPVPGLLNGIYLGVFCTFLAFLVQNLAQKHTSSTHAAIFLSLESVFGSTLSILLLGDQFTFTMLLGCIIIFLGIITAETKWSFLKIKQNNPEKITEH